MIHPQMKFDFLILLVGFLFGFLVGGFYVFSHL